MLNFILKNTTEDWFCSYCNHIYWYDVEYDNNNLENVLKKILQYTPNGSFRLVAEGWVIPLNFDFKHHFLINANEDLFYFIAKDYKVDKIEAQCSCDEYEHNMENEMSYQLYISSESNPFNKRKG